MKDETLTPQKPINILFTHYGDNWIRGSERCLLDLLRHINRRQFHPIVWCNSPLMLAKVRALGITAYLNDFPLLLNWSTPRFNIMAFAALIKKGIQLVNRHQVQLLHANSAAPNQWLNFVARICRVPLLAHLHSSYQLRDCMSLGLHQVPMLVGVSQPVLDSLSANGVDTSRCQVIANGIDCKRLENQPNVNLRAQLGLHSNDFLIATTASLIKRKGVDLIIDATQQLSQQGVPIHLVVIGDGEERALLERQIKRLRLSSRVSLLGEQTDVAGLLHNSADVFVSAAHEEVFGLALAEASLIGLPVVSTAVGADNLIKHNETGFLVESNNSSALAEALNILYKNPKLRLFFASNGRENIIKNFTIDRYTADFEKLYLNILGEPEMQTSWYRHWQTIRPILICLQRLLNLMLRRRNTMVGA